MHGAWQLANQGPIGVNQQQGFACAVPRVPPGFFPKQSLTTRCERRLKEGLQPQWLQLSCRLLLRIFHQAINPSKRRTNHSILPCPMGPLCTVVASCLQPQASHGERVHPSCSTGKSNEKALECPSALPACQHQTHGRTERSMLHSTSCQGAHTPRQDDRHEPPKRRDARTMVHGNQ